MNRSERLLYQQIHPAKLAADWGAGILSLVPFWNHQPLLGLLLAFGPSLIASHFVMKHVDLHTYKNSAFGKYISKYMGSWLQTVRLLGFLFMIAGAWSHDLLVMLFGLALILLAWLNGFFTNHFRGALSAPRKQSVPHNLPR